MNTQCIDCKFLCPEECPACDEKAYFDRLDRFAGTAQLTPHDLEELKKFIIYLENGTPTFID
jgi:hypothetical protein